VELLYVTDRCHQLDDPWGDRAIAVHFENPEAAAYEVMDRVRDQNVDGILALGDRPAAAAAFAARGLGIAYNHPAAVEACRSKLRMREVFRDAGLPGPWFRKICFASDAGARASRNLLSMCAETAFAFGEPRSCARE